MDKDWKRLDGRILRIGNFFELLRLDTEQDRLGNMKRGSHMHCEFWMQMDWDRMRNRLGYGKARSHVHCGFGHMPLDRKLFGGFIPLTRMITGFWCG